ncbi:PhnA domain-containing protein [Streptomyces sp. NPDC001714]|uniref:PhnA domain-containing protein n=1 Tax=Streptomyces sp. NPDC001714 TaxID=3364603 RepID=UPI0036ADD9C9
MNARAVCPECGHEWVKGSPPGIKAGTRVRDFRLVDGVDGHDIDCKVDGFGAMQLRSSVVKKG